MAASLITCTHYERCPRATGNFSIEAIFSDIRKRLRGSAEIRQRNAPVLSDGIFSRLRIIADVWKHRNESIHITGDIHFAILGTKKNSAILTIHDCAGLVGAHGIRTMLKTWIWFKLPVRHAAKITTVSEASKRDIIALTGCQADKVEVIPNAVSTSFQRAPQTTNTNNPRILQVGTSFNKNIERLAAALAGSNCRLVVIGELSSSQLRAIQEYGVTMENYVNLSEAELLGQYQACDLVSFVSTFEGFGMPIVEAQRIGRPVVTSNCSSMPEIAGSAACFVDPLDVANMREGFRRVIDDEAYRESLIAAGYANVQRFDGDAIAQRYLGLYRSVFRHV